MKTLVRAFVLTLVATGAYASVTTNRDAATMVSPSKMSARPCPMCPPGDPNGCNICAGGGCFVAN